MAHALATVAIPFAGTLAEQAEDVLRKIGAPLYEKGVPPPDEPLRKALDDTGIVHFMSINIARDTRPREAHLLLEVSADGGAEAALRAVATALAQPLGDVLRAAGIDARGDIAALLVRHYRAISQGWFAPALGLAFDGTPGMTVRRLKDEQTLAARIGTRPVLSEKDLTAREKLEAVRRELWEAGDAKWAFTAEPTPMLDPAAVPAESDPTMSPSRRFLKLLPSGMRTLFWPIVPVAVLLWGLFAWLSWPVGWAGAIALGLLAALVLPGAAAGAAFALGVRHLHRLEATDRAADRAPDPQAVGEIMRREGVYAQGLLASVSTMKPGRFRLLTLRLAFWFIVAAVARACPPGFLGQIGVIHFARWFLLPGTDKLFFWSNYDGAWESYVEDFVLLAHDGVTAVWSNTQDFPRTRDLHTGGAEDSARLRRWARRQMYPVLFWYSACPDLTLARVRRNAAIRRGIAAARTDADAEDWLGCFGAASRPAAALQKTEIPTLVFGGRKHMRHARCLVVAMSASPDECREWLRRIEPLITYGDDRSRDWAMAFALSSTGFDKLGVPADDLDTFPAVFRNGMTASWRSRALGDVGKDAPEAWWWGNERRPADAVVMVYAKTADGLQAACERVCAGVSTGGSTGGSTGLPDGNAVVRAIDLRTLPEGEPVREPFGFIDGTSHPLLAGTPRAEAGRHAIHAMQPGEFVLGYPDNSDRYPATPTVAAGLDPEHRLAETMADPTGFDGADGRRDLGRNGTFLVIRQLEQDVPAFEDWLTTAAGNLEGSPLGVAAPDQDARRELIAAKLIGRWRQDGVSLVRRGRAAASGRAEVPDNGFLYRDDAAGLGCPFGAHIRRANPRDTVDPESSDPDPTQRLRISNRHRLMRVGRPYAPDREGANPGILFMCLNADLERQFEFVQQTWLLARSFDALEDEADPVLGAARAGRKAFTIPTPDGPVVARGLKDFVTVRGGGYFFMPARQTVRLLGGLGTSATLPAAPPTSAALVTAQ